MPYDFKNVTVLVVENSPPLFQLLQGVLSLMTVPEKNIEASFSVEEAYKIFCNKSHDFVIIDWLDKPDRGIQLVKKIRMETTPNPILMTAGSGHKR